MWYFGFQSVYTVYCYYFLNQFMYVESSLLLYGKVYLIRVDDVSDGLMFSWFGFAGILLMNCCIHIHKGNLSESSFFIVSLCSLCYRLIGTHKKN